MKYVHRLNNLSARQSLSTLSGAALAFALAASVSQPAHAHKLVAPAVPAALQVEAGNKVFLIGHGVGTQNYICLPSGTGFAFSLFTPEATLFNDARKQLITHYFSPNPDENGAIRATWQFRDTSTVWAQAFVPPSFDPAFVASGAVPWLVLQVVGHRDGPTGGDELSDTTFIQRVNTTGGLAPSGCSTAADVGKKAFVDYTADYVFFTKTDDNHR